MATTNEQVTEVGEPRAGDVWIQAGQHITIYETVPGLYAVDGLKCVTCKAGARDRDGFEHFGAGCCWVYERVLKESGRLVSRVPVAPAPVAAVDWSPMPPMDPDAFKWLTSLTPAQWERAFARYAERGPGIAAKSLALEPWRPSVDPDHWIPDVGEYGTRGRGTP